MKNDDLKLWLIRFILFVIPLICGIYLFCTFDFVGKIIIGIVLVWNLVVVSICVCAIVEIYRYRHEVKKILEKQKKYIELKITKFGVKKTLREIKPLIIIKR